MKAKKTCAIEQTEMGWQFRIWHFERGQVAPDAQADGFSTPTDAAIARDAVMTTNGWRS